MSTVIFVAFGQGDRTAGYTARFPDLPESAAAGADMAGLIADARVALDRELKRLSDQGEAWPSPTPIELLTVPPGAIPFLVDVAVDDTPVRVNISIGERLLGRIDQAAEAGGMSRSGFIATAARKALGDKTGHAGLVDLDAVARQLQTEWSQVSRKITESLGPDSPFSRNMTDLDDRVTETVRKAAEGIAAAMARRKEAEARPASQGDTDAPPPSTGAQH